MTIKTIRASIYNNNIRIPLMADLTLFFNNPNSSDIVLIVNGEQFYLLSDVLENHTDFFKDMKITSQSISTGKDVIVSLVSKKVINIEDPFLKKNTVIEVLKFMYGSPLEVNATNVNDVSRVSNTFKIKSLVDKCIFIIKNNPNYDTLIDDYMKVNIEQSPMKTIYASVLKSCLSGFKKDKILDFTSTMTFEILVSFLESDAECDENFIYDIVMNYCEKNILVNESMEMLFGLINLDKLSGDHLVNKVKNNPHINKEKYYNVLENYALENKKAPTMAIFCFGKIKGIYYGYRLITEQECASPSFVKAFTEYYKKNNGLLSLDNNNADILCNDKHPLCIKGDWYVRLGYSEVTKNKIFQFKYSNGTEKQFIKVINSIKSHTDKIGNSDQWVGLFVPIETHF